MNTSPEGLDSLEVKEADYCELDPDSWGCRFPFLRDIDPYQAVGIISILAVIILLLGMYIVPAIRNHSQKKKSKSQTQTQRQPKQK